MRVMQRSIVPRVAFRSYGAIRGQIAKISGVSRVSARAFKTQDRSAIEASTRVT